MRELDPLDYVIFEFHRIGDTVKVSAVDPKTLTEVSIMGPSQAGEEALKRVALRKLGYVLGKNWDDGEPPPEDQSGWRF